MEPWKYIEIGFTMHAKYETDILPELTRLGLAGWELVAVVPIIDGRNGGRDYIFKSRLR